MCFEMRLRGRVVMFDLIVMRVADNGLGPSSGVPMNSMPAVSRAWVSFATVASLVTGSFCSLSKYFMVRTETPAAALNSGMLQPRNDLAARTWLGRALASIIFCT